MLEIAVVSSPIGPLTLGARNDRLAVLHFGDDRATAAVALAGRADAGSVVDADDPAGAATALAAYFRGDLHALDELPLDMSGTPFQLRVWGALRAVAPGHTACYSDIALSIGAPSAVRAVGAANGANPVAIVVPCHRIIGRAGSLTGYGGGLDRKRWLLRHEGALLI